MTDGKLSRSFHDSRMVHLDKIRLIGALDDIQKLKRKLWMVEKNVHLTFNESGYIIWKIDDYTKHQSAAENDDSYFIESPDFYTSQYGYKVSLRIYFKGHGNIILFDIITKF